MKDIHVQCSPFMMLYLRSSLGMDHVNSVIKGEFTKEFSEKDHEMVIFL